MIGNADKAWFVGILGVLCRFWYIIKNVSVFREIHGEFVIGVVKPIATVHKLPELQGKVNQLCSCCTKRKGRGDDARRVSHR